MTLALCRQVEKVLVERAGGADAVAFASMQHHLQTCSSCRQRQRTWTLVRRSASAANDVLDDLTRARVFGRVQAVLGAGAAGGGGRERAVRVRRVRVRVAWSTAFAAVLILTFVLGTRLRRSEVTRAVAPVALEPYAVHVPAEPRLSVPGKGLDHLELPPRASMRARLGPAADLTLLGPLELAVRDSDKPRVELELGRGTLLGDFDGSGGRSLRISTVDATVDIVGTRFMVVATATHTRVAVDHGLVRVESKGRVRLVGAGLLWSTDQDDLAPIDVGTAGMFQQAALGRWQELASAPVPADAKATERPEGATKDDRVSGAEKTGRGGGKDPTARRRRVRVHRRTEVVERASREPSRLSGPAGSSAGGARPIAAAMSPSMARVPLEEAPPPPEVVAPGSASPEGSAARASAPVAPATEPAPAAAPPAAPRASVSTVYKEAERAASRGDEAASKERLASLVRAFPHDVMADAARFELALLAKKDGNTTGAMAQIREILSHGPSGPFVEPARFLRCRVYLDGDRDAAETCLTRFVRDYPQSPHDDAAVRALIELSQRKGQCSKASQLAEVYLRRHPEGPFAQEAARVRSHCGD